MGIEKGSGGCFLNPPGDAEYFYHYEDSRSFMGLRSVLKYYDERNYPGLVGKVKALLEKHKGVLTEEWEHSVYNYFRGCYAPENGDRDASKCIIDHSHSLPNERSLAYLHIKEWFPDYEPNQMLILRNGDKGSWSSKKESI
jgi:hypothetical protein